MADYTVTLFHRLEQASFLPDQPWQPRSVVAISEKGKTYRAPIAKGLTSVVYQVDGYIIKEGRKCDKLLMACDDAAAPSKGISVFIELKGGDILHAIDQLEATLKNSFFQPFPKEKDKTRARIVTAGCGPKSSSKLKLEEARIRFHRLYHVELRVLKNNQFDTSL